MPKSGRRNIKKESIPILDGESSALPASPTAPLQSFQHDMPVQSQQQLQPPGPTQDRNGPIQNPSLRPQIMPSPQPRGAKIAIPRLRRYSGNATTAVASFSGDKHRVSHACEPCRQRKTKCSGERPTCKHCSDCKINCEYADGKRLRTQK